MKNLILAIVILAVAAGFLLEYRYAVVINSPVVAKLDRLTGDVWIANAGMWRKVRHNPQEDCQSEKKTDSKPTSLDK